MIIEKNFNEWDEFKILVDNSRLEWIYRGQSNAEWNLSTSLERSELSSPIEAKHSLEHQLIEEYKRAAQYYLDSSNTPSDLTEWLALIQHYGTPTRLIDFTESPYVAAYFAYEQANQDSENVSIWIINRIALFQRAIYYLQDHGIEYSDYQGDLATSSFSYSNKLLNIVLEKPDLDFIFPVEPFRKNQRYHIQQAIFIAPGNSEKPLLEQIDFLDLPESKAIIKVNLPIRIRNEVLRDLYKMNITRASLFPGLDGFAQTLNMRYSTLTKIGEITKHIDYLRDQNLI